ncbi:MAG: NADH-quinone oxidoreductase subunit C [Actinobacteria bacterium]|nr:NADH-quinone oxidoreductase subunit C [Actinomycetota bacterium]
MRGQQVIHPSRADAKAVLKSARDDGFLMCIDIAGVDYLTFGERSSAEGSERPIVSPTAIPVDELRRRRSLPEGITPDRFEVVINLLRFADSSRLRVRVQVPADDPTFPTVTDLWFGADAMEREVFDLFGIEFTDHPDLSRILMPEDWVGHPLRKDFNSGRIPVQFKGDPSGEGS